MDARERFISEDEVIRATLEQYMSQFWTGVTGEVVPGSYDPQKQTISVQPTIKSFIKKEDGTQEAVSLPILQDVPVQFPAGGGMSITFPIKGGEEVFVTFSSRSPDAWQQSGGEQNAVDARMHNLSFGFAMLGFRSNPKALASVDEDNFVIRSDDNNTKITVGGDGGVSVGTDKSVTIGGAQGITLNTQGAGLTINMDGGEMNINNASAVKVDGLDLKTHRHPGVQMGADDTGSPIA